EIFCRRSSRLRPVRLGRVAILIMRVSVTPRFSRRHVFFTGRFRDVQKRRNPHRTGRNDVRRENGKSSRREVFFGKISRRAPFSTPSGRCRSCACAPPFHPREYVFPRRARTQTAAWKARGAPLTDRCPTRCAPTL